MSSIFQLSLTLFIHCAKYARDARPQCPVEVGWLKARSMRHATLCIGWEGLIPHGADLVGLDHWMWLHPMVTMKETFSRLQGGN